MRFSACANRSRCRLLALMSSCAGCRVHLHHLHSAGCLASHAGLQIMQQAAISQPLASGPFSAAVANGE
jgi:hypothetical protein